MGTAFDLIYRSIVPLFLAFTFVAGPGAKKESYNFLYVLNTVFPFVRLLAIALYVYEIFLAFYGRGLYEMFVFSRTSPLPFYIDLIIDCTGLLFFNRKLRISRWFILINYLVITRNTWIGWFYNSSGDQLPSFWNTSEYYWWSEVPELFFILMILLLVYLIQHKTNKLPHASLFLK
ncbi:MAG: hypothetical protein H7Y86_21325 [Rhizobacter sp.]|nr:hypothetical protein [Ferruginibacter sp.]